MCQCKVSRDAGFRALVLLLAVLLGGCGSGEAPPRGEVVAASGELQTPTAPAATFSRPPNIIVVLVDTLRADALGFAGYARSVSPRLDAWSRRGAVFEQATTPAGWTKPAVFSLFTGLYPAAHGVQDKHHVGSPDLMMLAEVLKSRGYRTAAFITNFAVAEQFGTGQGFERFRWFDKELDSPPEVPKKLNYVPVGVISPEIEQFFREPPGEPYFTYIHTTDPHYPYLPPGEHRLFGGDSRDLYDGEVHYTDSVVGRWLDLLEQTGQLENSIVVLTADHGEEFREHGGTGHGVTVFEECVRVPMVLWGRGVAPGRHEHEVSLADLPRTLLEGAGFDAVPGFAVQSRSFWPVASGQPVGAADWNTAYSELVYPSKGIAFGYRDGDYKIVHIDWDMYRRRTMTMLFHVGRDPFEQRDLAKARPNLLESLQAQMKAARLEHLSRRVEPLGPELDEDATERLRALGYID